MDIIAVRHAVEHARKWAVEGNGPLLLEFVTYRYGGHSYVFYYIFVCSGLD
jgi:pyruvate dehydrogenase E1 component alpha subunit